MYLRYLVKMKHHISYFCNALLEYYPLNQAWCETKFIKYRENKFTITRYVQNVHHFDKLLFTTNSSNSKYNKIHNWKWLN